MSENFAVSADTPRKSRVTAPAHGSRVSPSPDPSRSGHANAPSSSIFGFPTARANSRISTQFDHGGGGGAFVARTASSSPSVASASKPNLLDEVLSVDLPDVTSLRPEDIQRARGRQPSDTSSDDGSGTPDRGTAAKLSIAALGAIGLGKSVIDQTRIVAGLPHAVAHRKTGSWKASFFTNTPFTDGSVPTEGGHFRITPRGLGATALAGAGIAWAAPNLKQAVDENGIPGLVTTGAGRTGLAQLGIGVGASAGLLKATAKYAADGVPGKTLAAVPNAFSKAYAASNSLGGLMSIAGLGVGIPNIIAGVHEDGASGIYSTHAGRTGLFQGASGALTTGLMGAALVKGLKNGIPQTAGSAAMKPGVQAGLRNMFHDPMIQNKKVGIASLSATALTVANEMGYLDNAEKRQDLGVIAGAGAGASLAGVHLLKHEPEAAQRAGNEAWEHLSRREPALAARSFGKRVGISSAASARYLASTARTGATLLAHPTQLAAATRAAVPAAATGLKTALLGKPGIALGGAAALGIANHFGAFNFLDTAK